MQRGEELPEECKKIVKEQIVPQELAYIKKMFPNAALEGEVETEVQDWLAKFMGSYIKEEDIRSLFQAGQKNEKKIIEKRTKYGQAIYESANGGNLSESDLNSLLELCHLAIGHANTSDHPFEVMNLTGKYIKLFSLDGTGTLGPDVIQKLGTIFREKFYGQPKQ